MSSGAIALVSPVLATATGVVTAEKNSALLTASRVKVKPSARWTSTATSSDAATIVQHNPTSVGFFIFTI